MTSRTNHHTEGHEQSGNLPALLSALQRRRQDAVKRDLDGDPMEAICRELGCSKSWLYTWKTRSEASEPTWSQERSRRPRTTPTTTPAAVEMAIVGLRETLSPGVSAQGIEDHLRRHQGDARPSRRTIARILKRCAKEGPSRSCYPQAHVAHGAVAFPQNRGRTGGDGPHRGVSGMTVLRHTSASLLVEVVR